MTIRALNRNTQTKRETGREEQDNKGRRTRHDKKTRQTRRDKKKCQKLSVRIIPAAEQKKVYIFVYLHQNVISCPQRQIEFVASHQAVADRDVLGSKPVKLYTIFTGNFFTFIYMYYGPPILRFLKLWTSILNDFWPIMEKLS